MIAVNDISFLTETIYDHAFVSCGFERRATYLVRSGICAVAQHAISYPGPDSHHLPANRALLLESDWSLVDLAGASAILGSVGETERIAIDVSSMPRAMLASVVHVLVTRLRPIEVDFFYAPAEFPESAAAASAQVTLSASPVSPSFQGSLRAPSIPISLMIGLGLEQHRAIGMIELLEPSEVWEFIATGGDPRFGDSIREMNRMSSGERDGSRILNYNLYSIAETFSILESLVFMKSPDYRIILAPSGPKVFALASLLVSSASTPFRPAVWRVGVSLPQVRADVQEAGSIIGGRARIAPS